MVNFFFHCFERILYGKSLLEDDTSFSRMREVGSKEF